MIVIILIDYEEEEKLTKLWKRVEIHIVEGLTKNTVHAYGSMYMNTKNSLALTGAKHNENMPSKHAPHKGKFNANLLSKHTLNTTEAY